MFNMDIVYKVIILFTVTYTISAEYVLNNYQKIADRNMLNNKKSCDLYSLLSTRWVNTAVMCAIHCTQKTSCLNFEFNNNEELCLICLDSSNTEVGGGGLTMYKGSVPAGGKLYEKIAARDCADHRDSGITTSGIYSITSRGRTPMTLNVYCDMDTNGGGWLVFQRRTDGSVDFIKTWVEYQDGFGNLTTEFWLGNEPISDITDQGSYELRIDMEDFDGNKTYASYDFFTINRQDKYRLLIGKYRGNAGDSLSYHNGSKWSTYDSDNDNSTEVHCAVYYKGAWWHNSCHYSNLNGQYLNETFGVGVNWDGFRGRKYSLKVTEMKIRPAGYTAPP